MAVTEMLVNEHGLIRRFLEELALADEKLENGVKPPRDFYEKAVQFARTFADRFHHIKEEYVMFVRLAQKKKGSIDAKIEMLRYQHDRGRTFVNEIANSLDGYEKDDPIKTTTLLENVAAYISLLRHHIHTEDHIFYPMVEEALSSDEKDLLLVEFEKENRKCGEKTFEDSRKLVMDMGSLLVHL